MGNTCSCPNPPGGYARCSDDQLAICRIVDGQIQVECIDPPAGLVGLTRMPVTALLNWILSGVSLELRDPDMPVDSLEVDALGIQGQLSGEPTEMVDAFGQRLTFRLPANILAVLGRSDEGYGHGQPTYSVTY
jgi:hypothetical protein